MKTNLLSRSSRSLLAAFAIAQVAGFSGVSCKKKPAGTSLVVGVQSEPMGGIVSSLHIVIRVAGDVVTDEVVKPPHGSRVGFPQPWEKAISADGKNDAVVDVEVDAVGDPNAPDPLIKRHATTHFVPGKVALLRVQLESRCAVYPAAPRGNSKVPGPH